MWTLELDMGSDLNLNVPSNATAKFSAYVKPRFLTHKKDRTVPTIWTYVHKTRS